MATVVECIEERGKVNLKMQQYSSYSRLFYELDTDIIEDLTACTLKSQIRHKVTGALQAEFTITCLDSTSFLVSLTKEQVLKIPIGSNYEYNVIAIFPSGATTGIFEGDVTVEKGCTH